MSEKKYRINRLIRRIFKASDKLEAEGHVVMANNLRGELINVIKLFFNDVDDSNGELCQKYKDL